MDESSYRAAVAGRVQSAEMRSVRGRLTRELGGWEIREFPKLSDLIARVPAEGYFPDLVIVCQHWRDEYAAELVRKAFEILPLARWICVSGAWCESEGRHGSRWPAAVRVPMSGWENRLALEANVVRGNTPALALTAARDEIFEFDSRLPFPQFAAANRTVAVSSPDREFQSWLADLCQSAGLSVSNGRPGEPINVWIVDLDPLTQEREQHFQALRQQHPQARFLIILGIVHPEDHQRLETAGAGVVLSKLTPAAVLLDVIGQLCGA